MDCIGKTFDRNSQLYDELMTCLCERPLSGVPKEQKCSDDAMSKKDDECERFKSLFIQSGDGKYATRLGELYCQHGLNESPEPDYEAAFKYFTMAADKGEAGGYLGKSKLALNGYGGYCKDIDLARNLAKEAYDRAMDEALHGEFNFTFPKAAMWYAQFIKHTKGLKGTAIVYYLEAKGILRRITCSPELKGRLTNEIDLSIMELYRQLLAEKVETVAFDLHHALFPIKYEKRVYNMVVTEEHAGEYILSITRVPENYEAKHVPIITSDLWSRKCYFLKELVVRATGVTGQVHTPLNEVIQFDSYCDYTFWSYGRAVAAVDGPVDLMINMCKLTSDQLWKSRSE